jgi:hypothetical protein
LVSVEKVQSQRIPKCTAIATVEGTRKIGRSRKRRRDEVEEEWNIKE